MNDSLTLTLRWGEQVTTLPNLCYLVVTLRYFVTSFLSGSRCMPMPAGEEEDRRQEDRRQEDRRQVTKEVTNFVTCSTRLQVRFRRSITDDS